MSYRRYAAERILASLAILFIAASLAFLLFHVFPLRGFRDRVEMNGRVGLSVYEQYVHPWAEAILLVATMLAVGRSLAADLVAAAFVPKWREPTR